MLLLLLLLGLGVVDDPKRCCDDGILPFSSGGGGGGGVGERSGVSAVGVGMVVIVRNNSNNVFHSGIDRVVDRKDAAITLSPKPPLPL